MSILRLYLLSALIIAVHFLAVSRGFYFIGPNPISKVIDSAISVAETGSFSSPHYYKLMEEVRSASLDIDGLVWQDIASIGRNGILLPKHSIISPIISAPFYKFFGFGGLYLSHFCIVLTLLLSLISLFERYFPNNFPLPIFFLALFALNPIVLFELGIYGYDIQIATFVIAGLALSFSRPLLGAGLLALSVFIRPSSVILLFPLQVLLLTLGSSAFPPFSKKRFFDLIMGTAIIYGGYGLVMWILYGTPLTTPYHNLPEFVRGAIGISNHPSGGDLSLLFKDLKAKLFNLDVGLVYAAPILIFSFIIFFVKELSIWSRLSIFATVLVSLLFVYSYSMWDLVVPRIFYPISLILSTFVIGWIGRVLRNR